MRILCMFPTKAVSHVFFPTLERFYAKSQLPNDLYFHISMDVEDTTMNNPATIQKLQGYRNLSFVFNQNKNIVERINKIPHDNWDILLLLNEDMYPTDGWDKKLMDNMNAVYPDKNGVLFFSDGQNPEINTLLCMGINRYRLFGHILHPSYNRLRSALLEFTEISQKLGEKRIDDVLINNGHEYPVDIAEENVRKARAQMNYDLAILTQPQTAYDDDYVGEPGEMPQAEPDWLQEGNADDMSGEDNYEPLAIKQELDSIPGLPSDEEIENFLFSNGHKFDQDTILAVKHFVSKHNTKE